MGKRFCTALLLALSPLLAACRDMPRADWHRLQLVRAELVHADAADYIPEEFAEFDQEYASIRREFARLDAQIAILRDSEPFEERLRKNLAKGMELVKKRAEAEAELSKTQAEELKKLSEGVESWGGQTWDPAVRGTISRMELAVRQAREAWKKGQYFQAAKVLDAAREDTEKVQSHFLGIQQRYRDPELLRKWQKWYIEAVDWTRKHSSAGLVIDKYNGRALLFRNGGKHREYTVELGWNWLLDKMQAGDGATPEGKYKVTRKKGRGDTKFFLALLLDYPNADDRRQFVAAKRAGRIDANAGIGGLIEIHGDGGRGVNWTLGCVALDNQAMKELFDQAYVGMPVTIVGRLHSAASGD